MIKVFTTFSGYDSQLLALRRIGMDFDCVGWSGIDPNAIKAHDAIFPEYAGLPYRSKQIEIARLTKDDGISLQRLDFATDRDGNVLAFFQISDAIQHIGNSIIPRIRRTPTSPTTTVSPSRIGGNGSKVTTSPSRSQ